MTLLHKPVKRVSLTELDGSYGPDRNKRLVITLIPGNGINVADLISLRPERARRSEQITVQDVYRYALRCRVGRELLEKARAKKQRNADRRAANRLKYAEKRIKFIK